MAIFNSFLYVYQRVPWGFPMMKHHSAMTSIMAVVMKCNESYIPWICVNMMGRPGDAGKTIYLRHACTLEPCHVASGTRECQSDVAHEPANQQTSISLLALILLILFVHWFGLPRHCSHSPPKNRDDDPKWLTPPSYAQHSPALRTFDAPWVP